MRKNLILSFAILALGTASAASYKFQIFQPSVVAGTQLKAGEYRVNVQNDKATITGQKQSIEVPVKVESSGQKFDMTVVRYTQQDGKNTISEIGVGGTKTRLVFGPQS
jgi:hypothetical protein